MPKVVSSDKKKLPKKYHDKPRYPVIQYGYEGEFKKEFDRTIVNIVTDITKEMVKQLKK